MVTVVDIVVADLYDCCPKLPLMMHSDYYYIWCNGKISMGAIIFRFNASVLEPSKEE